MSADASSRDDGAPTLLVLPSVSMARVGDARFLDIKAVEGLQLFAALWPGPVRCAMRTGDAEAIGYGRVFSDHELGFELVERDDGFEDGVNAATAALILAAADDHRDLDLPDRLPGKVAFIIEYTFGTRVRIVGVGREPIAKKLKTLIWLTLTERRRRRAMRRAVGLQANGTPAFDAYRRLSRSPVLFFDTRLKADQLVQPDEVARKVARVRAGEPLRLAFSGRLESMKGADHLPKVAAALAAAGVAFTLDIYGGGSLEREIGAAIERDGLGDRVRLRGPVSFDDVLVPTLRQDVDLFVCCHRQADPSCTYLETAGCGVPIVGYDNQAFLGVLAHGEVGEAVAMDDPKALAAAIRSLDRDRERLAALILNAAALGRAHHYESVFEARVGHLRSLL